jgi:SAM-dependent methyltransferase
MGLNHMNEQVTDTFRWYFPHHGLVRRAVNKAMSTGLVGAFRLRNWICDGQVLVNERIVEYPQVFRWIEPKGAILDIGCAKSRLPYHLASWGYEVHGIDARPYRLTHPSLHFHQTDLFSWQPGRTFDVVLMISTLEHFGLGRYGDQVLSDAERQAVQRIGEWLTPGGQLIITVPFGVPAVTNRHRIYDRDRLAQLFDAFEWVEEKYSRRENDTWRPSTAAELKTVASPNIPPNGVAMLNLRSQG